MTAIPLADRMARLGTESAFEVLARAKAIEAAGGKIIHLETGEPEGLISERSKLLIINSPHNPCGSSLTREDCEAIAEIAQRHDLTVLSDEVYWAIRYGQQPHASVLDVDGMADRTILLDGWS